MCIHLLPLCLAVNTDELLRMKSMSRNHTHDAIFDHEPDFKRLLQTRGPVDNTCTIVYECETYCGGIGDRLKGITHLFLLSIYFKCNFKVKWPSIRKHWKLKREFDYYRQDVYGLSKKINSIDRNLNFNDIKQLANRNITLHIKVNREPPPLLLQQLQLKFPFWIYIGQIWNHIFRYTELFKTMVANGPRCSACVHARIGDGMIGRDGNFHFRYHRKVECAARLTKDCVYIASDNNAFKQKYRDVPFIRFSDERIFHSDKKGSLDFSLKELYYLSSCDDLVCGGSGYALAARSLSAARRNTMNAWHASCINKGLGL